MMRVDSLRRKVYDEWCKNPYNTAQKTCEILNLQYKDHGAYVNNLLSQFRSYYQFGSPQKAHPFPKHRVFEWESVPRVGMLPVKWVEVVNRNGMWVFRNVWGTVHWYREGLVRLYLRGELQLAKAKELFCKAFSWFGPEQWKKYLDAPLHESYRKWTFDVGAPMPRFDIRQFERSHGIRIFTDGSDITSLHVEESTPFWIDEQRQATAQLGSVVQQFGEEIREHMKLIKLWEEEARGMRLKPLIRKAIKKQEPPAQKSILNWMI